MSRAGTGPGRLRIIGGRWRGRKLAFSPRPGLRPTADRTRETLFNWLAGHTPQARCADLFAGSGALGLEALSRGAAHVDFVDNDRAGVAAITAILASLGAADAAHCHHATAERFLQTANGPYDLVFLDPPFASGLAAPTMALLARRGLLAPGAMVYLETASGEEAPELPANWQPHREKRAGGVAYRLFRVVGGV